MQQGKGKRKGVKRERKEEVDGVMQLTSGLPREGHSSVRGITWSSYGFHDLKHLLLRVECVYVWKEREKGRIVA